MQLLCDKSSIEGLSYFISECFVFQPHKYIIQAVVLRNSWPISESAWNFVQVLKELEKNELKGKLTHRCLICL